MYNNDNGNCNINPASSNQSGDASVPNGDINVPAGTLVGSTAGQAGDAYTCQGGTNHGGASRS